MMIVLFIVLSQKQTSYTFGGYELIGPTGGTNHTTCLLLGMCTPSWKEGFYEARQRVTDTERTDL